MKILTSLTGKRASSPDEDGFTLIELLAVLTLVAIIMAAVFTALPSNKSTAGLRALAVELVAHLQTARSDAINRQRQNVVRFDTARHIVYLDGKNKFLRLDPAVVVSLSAAESEYRAKNIAGIRFFPNGSSTGGTLRLKQNRLVFEIRVNWLTGAIRLENLTAARL